MLFFEEKIYCGDHLKIVVCFLVLHKMSEEPMKNHDPDTNLLVSMSSLVIFELPCHH